MTKKSQNIIIDDKALKAIVLALDIAPEIVTEELTRSVWEAELLLEREIKELTPVGVGGAGGLKGSITSVTPVVNAKEITGIVGTAVAYASAVEGGTKPHMPPIRPLADWAQHKLGVAPENAMRVGFLIARKIKAKGTKGAHMFAKATKATNPQVQRIVELGVDRIAMRIGGAI